MGGRERETRISHHPFPLKLHYPTSFQQVVSHNTHFLHLKTQYTKNPKTSLAQMNTSVSTNGAKDQKFMQLLAKEMNLQELKNDSKRLYV